MNVTSCFDGCWEQVTTHTPLDFLNEHTAEVGGVAIATGILGLLSVSGCLVKRIICLSCSRDDLNPCLLIKTVAIVATSVMNIAAGSLLVEQELNVQGVRNGDIGMIVRC